MATDVEKEKRPRGGAQVRAASLEEEVQLK
jgi:hypothetical protein